jgi:hypothetical protein
MDQSTDVLTTQTTKKRFRYTFSTILKILLGIGALWLAYLGHYQGAVETLIIIALTYVPQHLGSRLRVHVPPEFESAAVLFICMTLFLGEVLDFYNRYWWWDVVLHAESGFLLGIVGFLLVYILNEKDSLDLDLSPGFIALFAFQFSITLGVLWEIFEFAMDSIFGLNMQKSGLVDTMWDLIVDCIGAGTISVMGYFFLLTVESDSFLERSIDRFIEANPHLFRRLREKSDN